MCILSTVRNYGIGREQREEIKKQQSTNRYASTMGLVALPPGTFSNHANGRVGLRAERAEGEDGE